MGQILKDKQCRKKREKDEAEEVWAYLYIREKSLGFGGGEWGQRE